MNTKDIRYAIPPGQIILDELEARGMDWEQFARAIGGEFADRAAVVDGSTTLTPEIADKIALLFETDSKIWLKLEEAYREAIEDNKPLLTETNAKGAVKKAVSGKLLLRIPVSLHDRASDVADLEGVSLNQLLMSYIAEGIGRSEQRRMNQGS